MNVVTVIGARPQFIKAAVMSAHLRTRAREITVHTGQHYDAQMSQVFFDELAMPEPDYHLGVGSGGHGEQTGEMLKQLEPILQQERPDMVLVYGDTNSTLAGALAASKLQIPIAHIEAGLRSFDRSMPEEINRVVTDHLSTLHFAPNQRAKAQLESEGIRGADVTGDLMIDLLRWTLPTLQAGNTVISNLRLLPKEYAVVTIHRASNTDDEARFARIVKGLRAIGMPIVFPVHPRSRGLAERYGLGIPNGTIHMCAPLSYRGMLSVMRDAKVILTDSGGIQKEAHALAVPCVTLRETTEWTETLIDGWNVLAGDDPAAIRAAALRPLPSVPPAPYFGQGYAAQQIGDIVLRGRPSARAAQELFV